MSALIDRSLARLDNFQRRHHFTAFSFAVIKKYSQDQAGQRAALLTYYGFLSLFPLLLIVTTLTQLLASRYPHVQTVIIHGVTNYFPVLGSQLSAHVHSLHRSGLALVVGLALTLYGARGVAGAFRQGVQQIWQVPPKDQVGFPKSIMINIRLIVVGGLGFIGTAVIANLAASAGHGLAFRTLSVIINLGLLFLLFNLLLNLSLPEKIPAKDTRAGAIAAAVGLVILQSAGNYLLKRELHNLDALYSYFALALGLLFWIYLQAQMLYYSVEIAAVHTKKLWPRSLTSND